MSDPLVSRILTYLYREKAVILQAWKPLIVISLLLGGGVWYATSKYYKASYKASYEGTILQYKAALETAEQRRLQAQEQVKESLSQPNLPSQQVQLQKASSYTISKGDELEFIQTLTATKGQKVDISYAFEDTKALALARRIVGLLALSGWEVEGPTAATWAGGPPPGFNIHINKTCDLPHGATLLRGLLLKRNIDVQIKQLGPQGGTSEGVPCPHMGIFIGPDPQDVKLQTELHQQPRPFWLKKEEKNNFLQSSSSLDKYTTFIVRAGTDPTTQALAEDLQDLLTSSGWQVTGIGPTWTSDPTGSPKGTIVKIKEDAREIPPGALLILSLFKYQEIKPRIEQAPSGEVGINDFIIYLGSPSK